MKKTDETKIERTARLQKLAEDIQARGGHIDEGGNLVMPMHMPLEGKQQLTGFDGRTLKTTTPPNVQEAVDYLLDKREELDNVKTSVEKAIEKVEREMRVENLKSVICLDKHQRPFAITLKTGKTKLEVKAIK